MIDASNGFWQIPVDKDNTKQLTFNTLFGGYRFICLPYSIHSVSEVFQDKIGRIIEATERTINVQDNIIV